jgi:hypothetical protein
MTTLLISDHVDHNLLDLVALLDEQFLGPPTTALESIGTCWLGITIDRLRQPMAWLREETVASANSALISSMLLSTAVRMMLES